ncbi:phosphate ABC transporter permease subunit PstC [Sphaerisporangium album]|uniref:phosphate ABC transporter permease subunit PstC n=1 Tax=Sphaerisporangium album TaxID=509200 RepID=UPI001C687993|nr:phosphate ABC transporter permease subunit PstC [Sphaerisporangium album]
MQTTDPQGSVPSDVPEPPPHADEPRKLEARLTDADRVYRAVVSSGAAATLLLITLIGVFLLIGAWPALKEAGFSFLTEKVWTPDGQPPRFGVAAMMFGTFVSAVVAMAITVPVAVCTSLFINEYAPRAVRRSLTSLVDLMAAIPSLIFAIWGLFFLVPALAPIEDWVVAQFGGWLPLAEASATGGSLFNAGLIVACMTIPITTSIIREVLAQAPRHECEGALALGGTRWGMITSVVLPFGKGGIIGGSMLGLGRALGETLAATLILSIAFEIKPRILENGGITVASGIAIEFRDAKEMGLSALMAAGLALFIVTFAINFLAAMVVSRSRSGAST